MKTLSISGRTIGAGHPTYVVAELSANHGHDFDLALRLVHAAKDVGADAIKVQTYTPDTITLNSSRKWFRVSGGTLWDGRTLYDLYQEAYMPWEWQPRLKSVANDLQMDFFSTPFDATSVEFLENMGVPAYKVASFELIDIPLLRLIARTGKPVIASTGMATLPEIVEAVETMREEGATDIALLKCTSAYPAPPEEMNLKMIPHFSEKFDLPAGLSDHTLGIAASVAAVALGACIVEKHFTLSRAAGGPDAAFSLEPQEFKEMVTAIRTAEKALGEVSYEISEEEMKSRTFRRSLFAVADIRAGESLTLENVRSIRPAYGLHPRHLSEIVGKTAACDIPRATPLSWEHVR
jgi:N-acetylneuraminate synthase